MRMLSTAATARRRRDGFPAQGAVDGDVVDSVALDTLGTLGLQHVSFETDGTDGDLFYITLDGKAADDNGANDADLS